MKIKICTKCNKEFPAYPVINGKRVKSGNRASCYECVPYTTLNDKINKAQLKTYKCNACKKEVPRYLKDVPASGLVYCSSSCAAKINNKNYKKVKFTNECGYEGCKTLISSSATYCNKCFETITKLIGFENNTLGQSYLKYNGSSRHAGVRDHARKVYKNSGEPKCCYVCGYSTYVEICHIKSIASFPLNTLINEVNDIKNLVALCPNHHKELDKGLIKIQKI